MLNVFALDVLKSLSREERESFRQYLESPFFSRGAVQSQVLALVDILWREIETDRLEVLEKAEIFQEIFPGKPVVESKIDKLMSELKRDLQDFLAVRRYLTPENEQRRTLDLATDLRLREMENRYEQTIEKLKKELAAISLESVEHYFFQYQVAMEVHAWESNYNKGKGDLNIPEALRQLDKYYWMSKIDMINRLILQGKLTILEGDAANLVQLAVEVPPEYLDKNPLLEITLKIHHLIRDSKQKVEPVIALQQLIQKKEAHFNAEKLSEFYTYLRNICAMLVDSGNSAFLPVLHEIQKDNLGRGYFYIDGKISPHACLSVTQIAIRTGATSWAGEFIEAHRNRIIGENENEDFYRINKTLYLFAQKEFDKAVETIPFVSSYSMIHLLARRLELKIYYELDSDLLPFKIDAFKMFLSRAGNKVLSEQIYELNVNFINFLRQISLSPKIKDKARSAQLVKRIEEKAFVGERIWLLEKARALSGRSV